jgi:hypothetical protein
LFESFSKEIGHSKVHVLPLGVAAMGIEILHGLSYSSRTLGMTSEGGV